MLVFQVNGITHVRGGKANASMSGIRSAKAPAFRRVPQRNLEHNRVEAKLEKLREKIALLRIVQR